MKKLRRSLTPCSLTLCLGLAMMAAVPWSGVGFGQALSEPAVALPNLPDTVGAELEIADLELAPPIAQEPILELALLGAYPLDAEMRAHPNELLDAGTAAFMLVNVFSLRLVDQFPVPETEALAYLEIVTGRAFLPDQPITVGDMRDFVIAFVDLLAVDVEEVRQILTERYPALQAGNVDAPITRAGGALMIVIAIEHLTRDIA